MDRKERLLSRAQQRPGDNVQRGPDRQVRRGDEMKLQGEQALYREDVGFRMTDTQYGEYQKQYTKWDQDLTEYQKQLSNADKQIKSARSQLDKELAAKNKEIDDAKARLDKAAKTTMGSLYNDFKKTFMTINIIGKNGQVEASYRAPKEVAQEAAKGSDHVLWGKKGNAVNISVMYGGRVRGNEIHQGLQQGLKDLENKFYEKNLPAYTKSRKEIQEGYGTINEARQNLIDSYQQNLNMLSSEKGKVQTGMFQVQSERDKYTSEVEAMKAKYQEKLAKRKALLGGNTNA